MKRKFLMAGMVILSGLTVACGSVDNKEVQVVKNTVSEQITEEMTESSKDTGTETVTTEDTGTEAVTTEGTVTETVTTEDTGTAEQSANKSDVPVQNNADTGSEAELQADIVDTENQDYYAVCTSLSKSEVEAFANEVKQLIIKKDWAGLSEKISYPVTIDRVTYNSSSDFAAANLDSVCDADFMAAIEAESCRDMFCNYQGIMLADGKVWISEVLNDDGISQGLKVTAINSIH